MRLCPYYFVNEKELKGRFAGDTRDSLSGR
jgi:hypothetical protein